MGMKPEKGRHRAAPNNKKEPGSHLTPQERKALLFIMGLLVLGVIVKWFHSPSPP